MNSRFFSSSFFYLSLSVILFSCGGKSTTPPPVAERQVTTFAGNGTADFVNATGADARFNGPSDIIFDASGNLYVIDNWNYAIRKITPAGIVTTYAGGNGSGFQNGPAASAKFGAMGSLVFDAAGNLYVTDINALRIRKITPSGDVSTFAGSGTLGSADGPALSASFSGLPGMAIDAAGNIFVTTGNRIRKVTPSGDVSTYASSPGGQGMRNGDLSVAQFGGLEDLVFDAQGNLYVLDNGNIRVRKITPAGIVSTLAGNGQQGFADGSNGETLVSFNTPMDINVDQQGNVYVADANNHRIRKITPTGATTTVAGWTNGFQDGNASQAKFFNTQGVVIDAQGNIYVGDLLNNRIRKISAN